MYESRYMKAGEIYADIAQDFETRFDTSNCDVQIQLPAGNNEK